MKRATLCVLFSAAATMLFFACAGSLSGCVPSKQEILVTEETWRVINIDTIYRANDQQEMERNVEITFRENKNGMMYVMRKAIPSYYVVGQVVLNLSRR